MINITYAVKALPQTRRATLGLASFERNQN